MSEFAKLAQDFVEATSLLVGQRTINIMDQKGIIIASTEKHRIGDFHQGAAEVLETGKPVLIKIEDLPRYPGTKEGYNMPIFLNDEIIGVVGIFGCEEEVQSIANLLRVYVTQSFSQFQMTQKQNLEAELRNQLLRLLLFGGESQKEMIAKLCGMLNLQLEYPIRIVLLYERARERNMKHLLDYSQLIQNLIWKNVLDRRRDVFGIQNADYVILLGGGESPEMQKRLDKLLHEIEAEDVWNAAVSSPCRNLEEISAGMREVSVLRNRKGGTEKTGRRGDSESGRAFVQNAVSAGQYDGTGRRTNCGKDASQAERTAWGESGGAAFAHSPGVLRMRGKRRESGGAVESA